MAVFRWIGWSGLLSDTPCASSELLMKGDRPTPEQILEELANKVAVQIDRLAPVAFDAAFAELIRHHRFLISINGYIESGQARSFAEIGTHLFDRAPHNAWTSQYSRLFERAAERLVDDPDFVGKLAFVPAKLLSQENIAGLPSAVMQGIVHLGPVLAHRLQAWLTKRTLSEAVEGVQGSASRTALVGSDSRAYTEAVTDLVGAWESLLQQCSPRLDRLSQRPLSAQKQWETYCKYWPLLWQHLNDTAHLLALAVWNEDEIGTGFYRDTLIRWPTTLDVDFRQIHTNFTDRRLLFPDLMKLDWPQVLEANSAQLRPHREPPTPRQLFRAVLRGAHCDVVLLTAALTLYWTTYNKQTTDIGSRTALALLRGELADPDDLAYRGGERPAFGSLMLDVLRWSFAGDRYDEGRYGAVLDGVVERLDRMTERRVISGRVYSPSTLHSRKDLIVPLAGMLLYLAHPERDGAVLQKLQEIAVNETLFPQQDRSLRAAVHDLETYARVLTIPDPLLQRAVSLLDANANYEEGRRALEHVLTRAIQVIEEQRRARLQDRPVSDVRLEEIRKTTESKLLSRPLGISIFRDFEVAADPDGHDGDNLSQRVTDIPKAQLVEPPMTDLDSASGELFSNHVRNRAIKGVWAAFWERDIVHLNVVGGLSSRAFWEQAQRLLPLIGASPVMVVWRQAFNELNQLTRENAPLPLEVQRHRPAAAEGHYFASIQGFETYIEDIDPRTVLIFSGQLLRSIKYQLVSEEENYVILDHTIDENLNVQLTARFRQACDWLQHPIYQLHCIDAPAEMP
jgi:hypothetical protein